MFKIVAMSPALVSSGVSDSYTGFTIRTTITLRKQFRELIKNGKIPKYKDMKLSNEELSKAKHIPVKSTRSREFFKQNEQYKGIQH